MSDPFVDELFTTLSNQRGAAASGPGAGSGAVPVPIAEWWREFVDVLGQKVGAWNERSGAAPVNFTRHEDGSASLSHGRAEWRAVLDGTAVTIQESLSPAAERRARIIRLSLEDGTVSASTDGEQLSTPRAAAELVVTPLFTVVFGGQTG